MVNRLFATLAALSLAAPCPIFSAEKKPGADSLAVREAEHLEDVHAAVHARDDREVASGSQ